MWPVLGGVATGIASVLIWRGADVNRRALAKWAAIMLAAAIGGTLPLAAVPDFAAPRTAFVPGVFLLAGRAGAAFDVVSGVTRGFRPASVVGVPLAGSGPIAVHLADLSSDPLRDSNVAVAAFFGVKSVRVVRIE